RRVLFRSALKKLSIEQLMNLQVTSVSKRPERLSQTASAIQVITQEDIRRSGASSLAEALRLAANLQVAQIDSRQWAISARGFNGTTANKLLVLIDGRTVYTPLFSGVFWDVQEVPLQDLARIALLRGRGDRQPRHPSGRSVRWPHRARLGRRHWRQRWQRHGEVVAHAVRTVEPRGPPVLRPDPPRHPRRVWRGSRHLRRRSTTQCAIG